MKTNALNFKFKKKYGSLTEQVFKLLQQYIVTGELSPNERLVESDIAKRFGISKTPVREALKQLLTSGYVKALPKGGLVVTDYSNTKIKNLFEIREALEAMAIRLACELATEEQINRAEEYYTRGVKAVKNNNVDLYLDMHRAFHLELCAACGNEQLLSLIQTFRFQYPDRRLFYVYNANDWRTEIKNHEKLLKSVRERNKTRAEKAVRRGFRKDLRIAAQRFI